MAQPISIRPESKRKRVEEPTASKEAATRSDVWFDDGNIVLRAGGTMFKVHKSVLSLHSTVLRGMFAIPQPSPEKETMVEGCSVVQLSDSASDMTIVLHALCQRGYVSTGNSIGIPIVAAFLRLGNKYGLDILHDEALKRLHYKYPTTLTEFDEIDNYSMIEDSEWLEIDVTNVAREHGLYSVLPVALYGCCVDVDAKTLAAGISRNGNGTTARLLPNDLITCLIAYQSLAALQASTTFSWIKAPHADDLRACTSRQKCANVRMEVMREVLLPPAPITGLCTWSTLQEEHSLDGMCTSCQKSAQKHHNEGRITFWDALPAVLGLPEWEELKKERE